MTAAGKMSQKTMNFNTQIFYFLVVLFLCTACPTPVPQSVPFPTIYYHNSLGQDLLDAATPDYFANVTISWINHDGTPGSAAAIVYKRVMSSAPAFLPAGYCLSVNPTSLVDNNGNSDIVYANTCTVFVHLTKADSDTIAFTYAGSSLKSFYYNKKLIAPPAGMTTYPFSFPVMVTK
jgi:hypothetical protein